MQAETFASAHGRGTAQRVVTETWGTAVLRYLFGPEPSAPDGDEAVLAEIHRLGGVVAAADVMRVTGLSRARAEARLCRLLARHAGDIEVGSRGGVLYRFVGLERGVRAPAAIWERAAATPPVTGNEPAVDLVLTFFSLLALVLSGTAIIRTVASSDWQPALALVPFLLALLMLTLPLVRLQQRRALRRQVAIENGRRALLRAVLQRPVGAAIGAHALSHAWACASGKAIARQELLDEVAALGGELDVDDHARLQFRFVALDEETLSLAEERRSSRHRLN
jgi:hypothetical protein